MKKTCSKCKVEKELSGFSKDISLKSGLKSQCKSCENEYYVANKERMLATDKVWYEENKERKAATAKAWAAANKDKVSADGKAWYENNKERTAATVKAWSAANPESRANYRNTRRAKKKGNGGKLITEEWKTVLASWLGRCASCGTDKDIHMDHIISLSMGGRHEASNTQPLCKSCNCSKGAKSYSFIRRASWQLMVMTCA